MVKIFNNWPVWKKMVTALGCPQQCQALELLEVGEVQRGSREGAKVEESIRGSRLVAI
jgi:hypothetical protein